jgi:hypothetical protein
MEAQMWFSEEAINSIAERFELPSLPYEVYTASSRYSEDEVRLDGDLTTELENTVEPRNRSEILGERLENAASNLSVGNLIQSTPSASTREPHLRKIANNASNLLEALATDDHFQGDDRWMWGEVLGPHFFRLSENREDLYAAYRKIILGLQAIEGAALSALSQPAQKESDKVDGDFFVELFWIWAELFNDSEELPGYSDKTGTGGEIQSDFMDFVECCYELLSLKAPSRRTMKGWMTFLRRPFKGTLP